MIMHRKSVPITKDGQPVLRDLAKKVPIADITSDTVQQIISDMSTAMKPERYAVAIAAPQISENVRIFVVAAKILKTDTNKAFINPVILKRSKKMQRSTESCLSIQGRPKEIGPDVAGIVARPDKMTISYYDEKGQKKERGASGFLAAIFDHEIDHLNGMLFIDKTLSEWQIDKDFNKVG